MPHYFASAEEFRAWLALHAETASVLEVGYHKRGSGTASMSWSESVDEALCVGWIDGVRRRIDAQRYCIRFTPRRPGSVWSAINIDKARRLIAEGRMRPRGEAAFAGRSEDKSRIYAYEQAKRAELDAAQQRAFQRHKAAWTWFNAQAPSYRHLAAWYVGSAKKPETRQARLDKLIALSKEGKRL